MKDHKKMWTATVKIEWALAGLEGDNKEQVINNIKESFKEQNNIHLVNDEITEVERVL